MRRRPLNEHISTTKVLPRRSDIISSLHRYDCGKRKIHNSLASVEVTYAPLHREFEATSDATDRNIFHMEGVNSTEESKRTCVDHTDSVVASEQQANYRRIFPRKTTVLSTPVCKNIILNPISVLVWMVCMTCEMVAVGTGDAVPINYHRSPSSQLQGRQTVVLMPPFDLGFRGQTSNGAYSSSRMGTPNYYNPFWRQEGAHFYPNGQNVKPGPPMSLTSGYSSNYHMSESGGYRPPFQVSQLPPQKRPSHELMQNDPVYIPDDGAHYSGMSKIPPHYAQSPSGYGNSKQSFDRYNRWQPQDAIYVQNGGYSGNVYNRQEQPMPSWENVESPAHNPGNTWNNGYQQYQSNWYDPAQVASSWQPAPYYDLPYQKEQQQAAPQSSYLAQGYGPAYGHPSNYGEVSEAELADRLAEYEENARKAGLLQETRGGNRIAADLHLPQLKPPDSEMSSSEKKKDTDIVISGSEAHDELMGNFIRVAAAYEGPYGVDALFKEMDLNNDRVIDIKELKKFLQLHEVFAHH